MLLDYLCLLKSVRLATVKSDANWPDAEKGMCLRFALATLQHDWLSIRELSRRTGYHRNTFDNALDELIQGGCLAGQRILSLPDGVVKDESGRVSFITVPVRSAECGLSNAANRLLWRIVGFTRNGGRCTASFLGLAGMLGVNERSISRDYAELKTLKFIRDDYGIKTLIEEEIMSRFNWWESSVEGIAPTE